MKWDDPSTVLQQCIRYAVSEDVCMKDEASSHCCLHHVSYSRAGEVDVLCVTPVLPPQAYRLEPLILKHYSNIAPVQIHW